MKEKANFLSGAYLSYARNIACCDRSAVSEYKEPVGVPERYQLTFWLTVRRLMITTVEKPDKMCDGRSADTARRARTARTDSASAHKVRSAIRTKSPALFTNNGNIGEEDS